MHPTIMRLYTLLRQAKRPVLALLHTVLTATPLAWSLLFCVFTAQIAHLVGGMPQRFRHDPAIMANGHPLLEVELSVLDYGLFGMICFVLAWILLSIKISVCEQPQTNPLLSRVRILLFVAGCISVLLVMVSPPFDWFMD